MRGRAHIWLPSKPPTTVGIFPRVCLPASCHHRCRDRGADASSDHKAETQVSRFTAAATTSGSWAITRRRTRAAASGSLLVLLPIAQRPQRKSDAVALGIAFSFGIAPLNLALLVVMVFSMEWVSIPAHRSTGVSPMLSHSQRRSNGLGELGRTGVRQRQVARGHGFGQLRGLGLGLG